MAERIVGDLSKKIKQGREGSQEGHNFNMKVLGTLSRELSRFLSSAVEVIKV